MARQRPILGPSFTILDMVLAEPREAENCSITTHAYIDIIIHSLQLPTSP